MRVSNSTRQNSREASVDSTERSPMAPVQPPRKSKAKGRSNKRSSSSRKTKKASKMLKNQNRSSENKSPDRRSPYHSPDPKKGERRQQVTRTPRSMERHKAKSESGNGRQGDVEFPRHNKRESTVMKDHGARHCKVTREKQRPQKSDDKNQDSASNEETSTESETTRATRSSRKFRKAGLLSMENEEVGIRRKRSKRKRKDKKAIDEKTENSQAEEKTEKDAGEMPEKEKTKATCARNLITVMPITKRITTRNGNVAFGGEIAQKSVTNNYNFNFTINVDRVESDFTNFLMQHGIVPRKEKIPERNFIQKHTQWYWVDYKAACRMVHSQLPPRKNETNAQKRTRTLLNNLLNRPDDEYLSAFYLYAAIGFMYQKDKFQPMTAKQFYSTYYIVGESDPEGEQ
ncbi:unnamed protein product [Bursaphelenchus okinawaensis]|uniref:Uncharacterized protein n=1 Tax=Bursaphelenchus okinawaensis TaxID=465554 RepID=A0A811K402_9BILA|nr:unnamed protein product [Bursaphelenchus okinawaensis]CAG9090203.1 unnamed protein product [Bursaphelenchus okinawaensis]